MRNYIVLHIYSFILLMFPNYLRYISMKRSEQKLLYINQNDYHASNSSPGFFVCNSTDLPCSLGFIISITTWKRLVLFLICKFACWFLMIGFLSFCSGIYLSIFVFYSCHTRFCTRGLLWLYEAILANCLLTCLSLEAPVMTIPIGTIWSTGRVLGNSTFQGYDFLFFSHGLCNMF